MDPQRVTAWCGADGKWHVVRDIRAHTNENWNVYFLCTTLCGLEDLPRPVLIFWRAFDDDICPICERVYERHEHERVAS